MSVYLFYVISIHMIFEFMTVTVNNKKLYCVNKYFQSLFNSYPFEHLRTN